MNAFEIIGLFKEAFWGSLIIALGCSVLGVYIVLRRIVFVSAALAQLSSAGIALAVFLQGWGIGLGVVGELGVSLLVTLLGVLFFALHGARYRVPPDAGLGIAYVVAGAVGILLIAKTAGADAHELFLQGNILGIGGDDVVMLAAVVTAVLLLHVLLYKEFLFISFDPEMARTMGYGVDAWNLLLFLTFGVMIAVAMQSAGVLLVFNFLVLPAVTGLLLGGSMRSVFAWAAASGVIAAAAGFALSVPFDLPTGPAIIAVSGVGVFIAWLFRLAVPTAA